MTAEDLQIISDMLTEIARTISVVATAQMLTNATSPEERVILSQALLNLISNFQGNQRLGVPPHMGYHGDPRFG
jgi:hypothetical protein